MITLYEVIHVFALGGTVGNFAAWAEVLIVANTLLVVFNSSINFAFYCGDTGPSVVIHRHGIFQFRPKTSFGIRKN